MVYLGKVIGMGANDNDRPFGVYAVSDIFRGSKKQKAVITPNGNRVKMISLDENIKKNFLYNSILVDNKLGLATISSGKHGEYIHSMIHTKYHDNPIAAMQEGFIANNYVESDEDKTPLITGFLDAKDAIAILGLSTEHGLISKHVDPMLFIDYDSRRENIRGVFTYSGDRENPMDIVIPDVVIDEGFELYGYNSRDLAQSLYNWMDPNFIISAAAALWDPDKRRWNLTVRNYFD